MNITPTPIPGLLIIEPAVFKDVRGYFFESYNEKRLAEFGIQERWVQDNQSCSQKGVVRGLHFQKPPFAQAKLVRILQGAALDFAVDIRKGSPTYGQYYSVLLTADKHLQVECRQTIFPLMPQLHQNAHFLPRPAPRCSGGRSGNRNL